MSKFNPFLAMSADRQNEWTAEMAGRSVEEIATLIALPALLHECMREHRELVAGPFRTLSSAFRELEKSAGATRAAECVIDELCKRLLAWQRERERE